MTKFQVTSLKRWVMVLMGLVSCLIFVFWALVHIFLPRFIQDEAASYSQKIGYQITYKELRISPLRLRLELDGLVLADNNKAKLLELGNAVIMLNWSQLVLGELGFAQILFEQPRIYLRKYLTKGGESQWNWQAFMASVSRSLPAPKADKQSSPLKVSVQKLNVTNASLSLSDTQSKLKEELKSFSIQLNNIANYDQSGEVNGLVGQYGVNLGAVQFTLPSLHKRLSFKRVAVKGALDNSGAETLGAQVDFEIDDGRILTHWDLHADKSMSGNIRIENLALEPFVPLLPANKELRAKGGSLKSEVLIEIKGDDVSVAGDLHLNDLDIWESGRQQALLNWRSGDLNRFTFKYSKASGSWLGMQELVVNQPVLRYEIDEQGFSNFRRLFSKPTNSEVTQVEDKAQPQSTSPSRFLLDIKTVQLRDGSVLFADLAMRPQFHVDIRRFNATVQGLSNAPGKFAGIDMNGVVAQSGAMRAKGKAAFDDPRRNNELTLNFKDLPLSAFNPAAMTFAGYQIAGGRLNLNLNYQTKDGELKGSNQIVIKKVELGDEVPDFQGKKLPLGLAIALLEDADDTIDVTINIAGNVDAPQFSATGLVWQAISNVLTNVATAPFRAIGALLGMGGDEGIYAVFGQAVYLPDYQDRLEKFGGFLDKKPHASLELTATYDVNQDQSALARANADAVILKAAGIALLPNEVVPNPDFSDPRIREALKSAYVQYVGRIKLAQRLLTLPDDVARSEQLRSELIASIPITENELKILAKQRANLALQMMTKNNPGLKERIVLTEVKAVNAPKEGAPLEVEVRIK